VAEARSEASAVRGVKLAARQGVKSEASSEASSRREEARIEVERQRRAAAEGSICSRENKGAGAGTSNSRQFGLGANSDARSEAKSEAKSKASDEARRRREGRSEERSERSQGSEARQAMSAGGSSGLFDPVIESPSLDQLLQFREKPSQLCPSEVEPRTLVERCQDQPLDQTKQWKRGRNSSSEQRRVKRCEERDEG
jgi:hypothetical protein